MHQISGWTRFYQTAESTKWVWEVPITKCTTDKKKKEGVTIIKAAHQAHHWFNTSQTGQALTRLHFSWGCLSDWVMWVRVSQRRRAGDLWTEETMSGCCFENAGSGSRPWSRNWHGYWPRQSSLNRCLEVTLFTSGLGWQIKWAVEREERRSQRQNKGGSPLMLCQTVYMSAEGRRQGSRLSPLRLMRGRGLTRLWQFWGLVTCFHTMAWLVKHKRPLLKVLRSFLHHLLDDWRILVLAWLWVTWDNN